MQHEKILILDFGSQYTQLIARRVRELNIYSEIHPYNKMPEIDGSWKAVILSGSPHSVREENAPIPNLDDIKGKLPLLGVCYGAQHLVHKYGGEVLPSNTCSIFLRQSAITCSTAGFTCSGKILENGGKSVKVSNGLDMRHPFKFRLFYHLYV